MSEERGRKSHAMDWTLSIVAVPVLYVLSIGPLVYFDHLVLNRSRPYTPPVWLKDYYLYPVSRIINNTSLAGPMDGYAVWWVKLAE